MIALGYNSETGRTIVNPCLDTTGLIRGGIIEFASEGMWQSAEVRPGRYDLLVGPTTQWLVPIVSMLP